MSKFDTNGGYFAPKDYLKVNEGGSHEENPNGGVQIGVDPEGTPNLLEEGEPVYKDYVYSDNISAEREFLEQNHLPGKYEGKLYSKIADDILKEAEERPLDPISRNGLEALLGRLADAQEGQKQAKEQKDLEEELANLSPEELDQLEQMLAQGEQGQMAPEQMPVEAIPQEQMMGPAEPVMQQPVQGMPMMRCGGKMARKFSAGGDVPPGVQRDPVTGEYYVQSGAPEILSDNVSGTLLFNPETGSAYNPYFGGPNDSIPMLVDEDGNLIDSIDPSVSVAFPGKTQAWVDAQVGPNSIRRKVAEGRDQFLDDAWEMGRSNLPLQFTPVGAGMNVLSIPSDIEDEDWGQVAWDAVDAIPYAGKGLHMIGASAPFVRMTKRALRPIGRGLQRLPGKLWNFTKKAAGWLGEGAEREAMYREGKEVFDNAKDVYKKAWTKAQRTASELDDAKAALKENPNDNALKETVEQLESKSAELDKQLRKAGRKLFGSRVNLGVETLGGATVGPLRSHTAYEKAVKEARTAYNIAKEAADAAPENAELAEVAAQKLKDLNKAEGFWNKWVRYGWGRFLPKVGGAVGTAIALEKALDLTGRQEKREQEIDNQYNDGGKLNLFYEGGRPHVYRYSVTPSSMPRTESNFKMLPWIYDDYKTPWLDLDASNNLYGIIGTLDGTLYDLYGDQIMGDFPAPYADYQAYYNATSGSGATDNGSKYASTVGDSSSSASSGVVSSGSTTSRGTSSSRSGSIPFDRSIDGNAFEAREFYQNFLKYMLGNRDSEDSARWRQRIQDEIKRSGSSYILKDFDDWYRLATDKNVGPVHRATEKIAQEYIDSLAGSASGNIGNGTADYFAGRVPRAAEFPYPRTAISDKLTLPVGQLFDINTQTGYRPENASLGLPELSLNNPLQTTGVDPKDPLGRNGARTETEVDGVAIGHPDPFAKRSAADSSIENKQEPDKSESSSNPRLLPTWPRYAGAIGSGLLGLYNAFQSPDRYKAPRINPQLPEGRINLQNQVYNPIDQNIVANSIIAQSNATNRALRNSGLGASTASAVLAADNNTTGNLGTGFLQTWDANNQRRNAVIAANNQAEAQRANFDYTIDAARKQILNDAAVRNAQNDFLAQRLNYQAEGDKYTAISNQISNGLQALSGIGKENFAMNQINTNPANLGYRQGPNGEIYYFNPLTRKWEETKVSNPTSSAPAKGNPQFTMNLGSPYNNFSNNPLSRYPIDPFMGYRNYNLDKDKKKTK